MGDLATSPLHPVVAIDGPAASGKSSVARETARRLGFCFVSSGLLYRAAACLVLQEKAETVADLLPHLQEVSATLSDQQMVLRWQDETLESERLSGTEVNALVSTVAAWPEVRAWTLTKFRSFARLGPLVMEGRDIGSVVFPETPYKIYLDASPEVREARRRAQGITDAIARRDREDSTREHAPLAVAAGALLIDNSHLNLEETVEAVLAALREQGLPV